MNKQVGNLLWGFVLILLGVVFGLNAMGVTNINIFFDGWWTLFIIVPCFIGLIKEKDKTGNIIGLIIGACLLLGCQNILNMDMVWKLMVPFILVAIGLTIIFKNTIRERAMEKVEKLNSNENNEYYATFAGQNLNFNDEEFKGCALNAIFGGIKCDLKKAVIKENVEVKVSAIFGGVTIYVPENVKVKVMSVPIFGGVSDERKIENNNNFSEDSKTIYINATTMFGGVEIK